MSSRGISSTLCTSSFRFRQRDTRYIHRNFATETGSNAEVYKPPRYGQPFADSHPHLSL